MKDNFYLNESTKLSILPYFINSLGTSEVLSKQEIKKLENMIPISFYPKIHKL
jgi:hypothetical protein